jgi:gliding motility-associated protein GldM
MGATNCPETPRQKMISMMYLVYTALLALNVSVQILDGYELVQDSLKSSITIASNRNNSLAAQFEALAAQNPAKTKQWKDQSAQVAQQSDALCNQIDEIKKEIITKIGGDDMDLKNMNVSKAGRGDLNISSQVGIVEGKGKKLNAAIGQYSSYIQSVVAKDAKRAENIKQTFNTETVTIDGQKKTWESRVFEDMPAIATLTLLTKVQNDIRNTEAEVAQYLIGQVDAGDFRVNKIQAIAVPTTSYVLRGGKYEAQIILAARQWQRRHSV